jgi:hypothetical protein
MSKTAVVSADTRFQRLIETERIKPVRKNLFTGEPETLRVDVPEQLLATVTHTPGHPDVLHRCLFVLRSNRLSVARALLATAFTLLTSISAHA